MLTRPKLAHEEIARFLSDRGLAWKSTETATDAEHVVEICGRVCYMSFSMDTSKVRYPNSSYIKNLIEKGHDSVLEHANWTFILDGVSRAFTHQLVRHRIGFSFSQLSQQYHDESTANLIPPERLDKESKKLWKEATQGALAAYRKIVELTDTNTQENPEQKRLLRSAARSLLPNATETTIAVTANARSIRHFLSVRGAIVGDPEMRKVSAILLEAVSSDAPTLFDDFETTKHEDGLPITRCTSVDPS